MQQNANRKKMEAVVRSRERIVTREA